MAKKPARQFVCTNCGAAYGSWSGKCPNCGEWNTLEEQLTATGLNIVVKKGNQLSARSVKASLQTDQPRLKTSMAEMDEIFGGGLVTGSVNLIAGPPGIGKSTLLLQLAEAVAKKSSVLYVSGEESLHQVGLRAKRLNVQAEKLELVASNSADDVAATIATGKFDLVIVDSIQTISTEAVASAAGTVSQITNSTRLLTLAAKQSATALILVGHVTKEGMIAGPRVLEHAVDVVLQLEGDLYGGFKVLRSSKNRFGSIEASAIFEMTATGLKPVENPSAALLSERQITDGSIVLATMEGNRALLVEIQALVNPTSFGYPKRTASGYDLNRLNLLVAMLERRTKLRLREHDIYINVVGGLNIKDPAADLAISLAIGSAAKGLKLKKNAAVFGEVGLSGEIRHVPNAEKRLNEAKKLGFDGAIGPRQPKSKKLAGLVQVADVRSALNLFLEKD